TARRRVRAAMRMAAALPAVAIAVLLTSADVPAQATLSPVPGGGGSRAPAAAGRPLAANRSAVSKTPRLSADLLIVSQRALPAATAAAVQRLPGVVAAQPVDAAQIRVNGKFTAVLGVDPMAFRQFAARPTAAKQSLWRSVAGGRIAISYTMSRDDRVPLGGTVRVAGRRTLGLRVGGVGTVGIGGVDAVISHPVARSLGFPLGNAILVSAPHARPARLRARLHKMLRRGTHVEQLAGPVPGMRTAGQRGAAGSSGRPGRALAASSGAALTPRQTSVMLHAALSRVGMPYVWGAAGPSQFDCSGLVQWAFARAGVGMPRVAADQARTGPAVPMSRLQPGDLLFYRTDPTAPGYISHVAIYLGKGMMLQAPQPGMRVQVVPAQLSGSAFAGAVAVAPVLATRAAASPVG
ncbi:MAG: C40 family peptidase, partial [Nocardiopsaceae bacterium]|nr:C40 family peptidase [Nocardiopsaceae bacterium]